jgi:hypothetical protein
MLVNKDVDVMQLPASKCSWANCSSRFDKRNGKLTFRNYNNHDISGVRLSISCTLTVHDVLASIIIAMDVFENTGFILIINT